MPLKTTHLLYIHSYIYIVQLKTIIFVIKATRFLLNIVSIQCQAADNEQQHANSPIQAKLFGYKTV